MTLPSLTQTEAAARAALISVHEYRVVVDLTGLGEGSEVRCSSTIRFGSRETGAQTFVDCAAQVVSASLNGISIAASAVTPGRIALIDLEPLNELVVESAQAETATDFGVHKAVDPADGNVYVWTSFEPDDCRYVWACFDQPDLKATHALTVLAPAEWTVLSNSGRPDVDRSGGTTTWTFAPTPPLSTYNVVVLAGPLVQVRAERDGYDLGLFARASLRSVLERDAPELFELTARGLAFFGERFGMPFPQLTYDQAFMPEFGGAMENYGCVTWSDAALYRNQPTEFERMQRATILLHEMAHMWFGNIVTMRWWDDLWLNEAFAEFAAHWSAVSATEFSDMWAAHLARGQLQAYLADQGPASHPIRQRVPDVAAAAGTFDTITYPKGASVLHQLMAYIGEDAFIAGMRSYFARYAWTNTTLDELINELAAASGQELHQWAHDWLGTAGVDRLRLERTADGDVLVAEGPPGVPPRPHALDIGLYRRHDDQLQRTQLLRVSVDGSRTRLPDLGNADLVLVNDENLTFATVTSDTAPTAALLRDMPMLPTPLARAVAVATAWNLLITGGAPAVDVVRSLRGVIGVEAESLLEPFLNLAIRVAEWWAPQYVRERLLEELADVCVELNDRPEHRAAAMRGLARTAITRSHFELLDVAADTPDLRWRVLTRRAEYDQADDAQISEVQAADPDPDAWIRALTVRAARPSASDKDRVWRAIIDEQSVPVAAFGAVGQAFWRPGQGSVLAPYPTRFLDALPEISERGMIFGLSATGSMFPMTSIDEDYLDQLDDRLRSGTLAPVVANRGIERAYEVRRMIASRARTAAT
jgi:aminopeptidase N